MVHPEYIINIIDIFYVIQDTLPEWSPLTVWDHDDGDVSSLMP